MGKERQLGTQRLPSQTTSVNYVPKPKVVGQLQHRHLVAMLARLGS